MKKLFIFLFIFSGLILPMVVLAQGLTDPLVICGRHGQPECTLCDLFRMAQRITDFIYLALMVIAPVFIIAGGITILTSGVKPDQLDRGKKMITFAITGIIIAFLAWTIINVVMNSFGGGEQPEGFPWPWNRPDCVGGGVALCTFGENFDANCPSGQYCDSYNTKLCVSESNLTCEWEGDCPSGECDYTTYRCVPTPQEEVPGEDETGNYCCCTYPDRTYICAEFNTYDECRTECLSQCQSEQAGWTSHCCLPQRAACSTTPGATGRCGELSPAGSCLAGNYQCAIGVYEQLLNISDDLITLLACMANATEPTIAQSDRLITSITDNSGGRCVDRWTGPECNSLSPIPDSCTGTCCAHAQNSLHYGGSGCRGISYAVDFGTVISSAISTNAAKCAASHSMGTVTVTPEVNHIHLQLDSRARNAGCL